MGCAAARVTIGVDIVGRELRNAQWSSAGTPAADDSRIDLYGPISMECPASIMRLGKGTCYVSEAIAKSFGSWPAGIEDKDL